MKVVNAALLTTSLLASQVGAKVIYGEDNRKEVFEAQLAHQVLARSAATMVPVENFVKSNEDGTTDLLQVSFAQWLASQGEEEAPLSLLPQFKRSSSIAADDMKLAFCSGERFVDQPNPGMCSGFLIAPDLIVTAGHCTELPAACEGYKWVFDFKVDAETGSAGLGVKSEDIYSCKRVITSSLSMDLGTDFAIIQLDRKVEGRQPLEIRFDGMIEEGTEILVIGNPSGLPLKVTDGAKVRANTSPMFFSSNLDTFQGNSGSAVFNAKTGVVEGILVRGEEDFAFNEAEMCLAANKCDEDSCRGEDVSRMTSIPEVALKGILDASAETGDTVTLEKLLNFKIWVDFYGKDGVSALMKAAAKGMSASITTLLAHGADVNLTDANGDTALHHLARVLTPANVEALNTLVAANAKLEAKNKEGKTPMMLAELTGNAEGHKLLLQAGARE